MISKTQTRTDSKTKRATQLTAKKFLLYSIFDTEIIRAGHYHLQNAWSHLILAVCTQLWRHGVEAKKYLIPTDFASSRTYKEQRGLSFSFNVQSNCKRQNLKERNTLYEFKFICLYFLLLKEYLIQKEKNSGIFGTEEGFCPKCHDTFL